MAIIVGLDLGIASVGWAVIDTLNQKILGRGVRIFKACEDPKTKTSLAVPRRNARGTRRRLRRRAQRMRDVKQLFLDEGFFSQDTLEHLYDMKPGTPTPYALRVAGLERKLTAEEWARVLTQLCKRRGYKSMRLDKSDNDEKGKVKAALAANRHLMEEKGYRTAAEMLVKDPKFNEHIRNKGSYDNVLTREMLLDEIEVLFQRQAAFGNPFATSEIKAKYLAILQQQKRILEGEALIELVGQCTFIPTEKRAPQASFSYEKFRFLQRVTNIRWTDTMGVVSAPTSEQISLLLDKALSQKTELNYKNVRQMLDVPEGSRFTAVRVKRNSTESEYLAEEVKTKLPAFKVYSEIRTLLAPEKIGDNSWEIVKDDEDLLNKIGEILTYYKYEDSVVRELESLGKLSEAAINALSKAPAYSKNGNLSIKVLQDINTFLLQGHRYDEATLLAGYHHSVRADKKKSSTLPAIPHDQIVNPVVIRTLAQTRKVINAIIREFGPFDEVHIEFAREMNKSKKEREEIEKDQKERAKQAKQRLESMHDILGIANPRPADITKYRLLQEQNNQCAYSGKYIEPTRLTEPGYVEVDHILPYSRSFNNSLNNKVLVLTEENQKKGPRTPWEYKQGDAAEWARFEAWVMSSSLNAAKKRNLLTKTFSENEEEFRERNLNDTRYAARFLKTFIEDNLEFENGSRPRVVPINGGITAYVRNAWQLQKDRSEDGDRHHALDALVIAAVNSSVVQKIGTFFGARFLRKIPDSARAAFDYYDKMTGELIDAKVVPEIWPDFADHVRIWMAEDPLKARVYNPDAMTFEERNAIKPLFVSRMPRRKVTGAAHKETLKRIIGEEQDISVDDEGNILERKSTGRVITAKKVSLDKLTYDVKTGKTNFENMVEKETTNKELYEALVDRLKEHGGKGTQAFKEPFYKPSKPGKIAPIVRSITVTEDPASGGVMLRGGMYENGSMIRIDIFSKPNAKGKKKFYIVPIYVADTAKDELPNKAIVAFKSERDWLEMDESYEFEFSLYPGDLFEYWKNGLRAFGYYLSCDRSTGKVIFDNHDSTNKSNGIGVQNLEAFIKYNVDILGINIRPARGGKRNGFSNGNNKHSS